MSADQRPGMAGNAWQETGYVFTISIDTPIELSVNPRVVMETPGHALVSLTLHTYTHVLPALQTEVVAKMDAILAGS
jgi:hypothetical protein